MNFKIVGKNLARLSGGRRYWRKLRATICVVFFCLGLNFTLLFNAESKSVNGARLSVCEHLLTVMSDEHARRVDVLKALAATLGPHLKEYVIREYGFFHGRWMSYKLTEIAPSYLVLAVDPGLMAFLDEFADFVKSLEEVPEDPWRARQEFSRHLGHGIVYRSIGLRSQDEAEKILRDGLSSRFTFNTQPLGLQERIDKLSDEIESGLVKSMHNRFGRSLDGRLRFNIFQSVSFYPDVALAIATSKYGDQESPYILLLEIKLPQIDIIQLSRSHWVKYPSYLHYGRSLLRLRGEIHIGAAVNSYKFTYKVESLVFHHIKSSEIQRAYLLESSDTRMPKWSGGVFGPTAALQVNGEALLQGFDDRIMAKGGK